jgi:hypothetical protein
MNRHSIPELPAIPPQWEFVQGKIRWRGSKADFLRQARLGDARLEHLVPYVLSIGHKSFAIPSVRSFPRSLPPKCLRTDGFGAKTQNVIRYLQTNQVLATLAFSYKIQYHAPFDSLHTFADAMEAFIESLFSSDIWHNNLAALEWLVALWSPTCFPLLQADLAAYDPPPGAHLFFWRLQVQAIRSGPI